MADWITTHHDLCDGSECNTWDCASLPENVGQWRQGEVVEVLPNGDAVIEWSDGTRDTLKKRRPSARALWADGVRRDGRCGDPMCLCKNIDLEDPK